MSFRASPGAFDSVQGACPFYKLCQHFEHVLYPAPASSRRVAATSTPEGSLDKTLGEFSSITPWAVCAVLVWPQLHKASVHDHLWKTALLHTFCSSQRATSCSFRIAGKIVKATLIRVYCRQCPAARSPLLWCFIMMCLPMEQTNATFVPRVAP